MGRKSNWGLYLSEEPVLETARLVLRPPRVEDLPGWAAFSADPETMRHLGGPQCESLAWRAMATMAGCWALNGFGMFSVLERSSRRWVGRVGPWRPHGWPGNEVGWGILREFEGKGYAYEAASACIDWSFEVLGWDHVIHCIPEQNLRSIALAHRLGSKCQHRVRLPPPAETEVWAWGQTREAWVARARAGDTVADTQWEPGEVSALATASLPGGGSRDP
ncbi:MAG: GNAT family N-acetyltransferase [Steroidobacteraceae bacterium]|jgi:RimJ/RimL family protein N-acetyltransferase